MHASSCLESALLESEQDPASYKIQSIVVPEVDETALYIMVRAKHQPHSSLPYHPYATLGRTSGRSSERQSRSTVTIKPRTRVADVTGSTLR